MHYPITDPVTGNEFIPPQNTGWRYSEKRMLKMIENGQILFPSALEGRPREKKFRSDMQNENIAFPSIISDVHTAHGTPELQGLFGTKVFDFPKPTELIRRLIHQTTNGQDIILDFLQVLVQLHKQF
ncbi:MAG: site-specific DNA-methyltransferase [Chloroflexi bacterium]|nr:site-specific DNA-methyltransferase [Chloroflexota bacterium]